MLAKNPWIPSVSKIHSQGKPYYMITENYLAINVFYLKIVFTQDLVIIL